MKRIMILGANILQVPLIKQTIANGDIPIVVSPDINEIGHTLVSDSIQVDLRDEKTILKYAREYDIAGIITDQTDIAVRSVAYVAEKMDLPGIGYDVACLFTDKARMRKKCRELNINILKYDIIYNLEDALSLLKEFGGKAIIKPVDSQGSRGVFLIDSSEKMKEKFTESIGYSNQKEIIIEEVACGREFVVEGLAYDYNFQNLIIGDTYYFDIPDVFSATQRIFPTNAENSLKNRVAELNKKIIEGFGLKQGITHSEFIMNNDDIFLIETAARGGGVFISSDLINLSTGLCTENFLLKLATGDVKEMPVIDNKNCACCYTAFYLPVGEVVAINGIDEVMALPYTHRNNLDSIKIGMKVKTHTDKTSRFFTIISADTRELLNNRVDEVKKLLNGIKVKTSNNLINAPIWK